METTEALAVVHSMIGAPPHPSTRITRRLEPEPQLLQAGTPWDQPCLRHPGSRHSTRPLEAFQAARLRRLSDLQQSVVLRWALRHTPFLLRLHRPEADHREHSATEP